MDAINSTEYRSLWISRGYSLILSDTWNDNKELLRNYGEIVKGSFSFKANAGFQVRAARLLQGSNRD